MEDLTGNLTLQLAEVEMLQSMYDHQDTSNAQFKLNTADVIILVQDYIDGSNRITLPPFINFTLYFGKDSVNLEFELACSYPHTYPQDLPEVYLRSQLLSREKQKIVNEHLTAFLQELDRGELCMCTVIEWIQEYLRNHKDTLSYSHHGEIENGADGRDDMAMVTFTRMWIYCHHIFKDRKKEVLGWGHELCLTGFCMPGKPGIICVEGLEMNCEDYWQRLKHFKWKRLECRNRIDVVIPTTELTSQRLFHDFKMKTFDVQDVKSNTMNLAQLQQFMTQNNCGEVYPFLFDFK
ncbi:RWD domain-containing protein 2B-like [Glandiceps talaboti]